MLQERLRYTMTSRQIVNFEFWRDRSDSGKTETSTSARKHLFEAKQLFAKPDLEGAKTKFEQSFKEWAQIFEKWPSQKDDADNEDLVTAVETYIKVLEQLDLRDSDGNILPTDFPLVEIVKSQNKEHLLKIKQAKKDPAPDDKESTEEKKSETPSPDKENSKSNQDQKPATDDSSSGDKR
jgi:hypothetical protein